MSVALYSSGLIDNQNQILRLEYLNQKLGSDFWVEVRSFFQVFH